ncbi:C40 family peptidase [Brevibacillus ginsengisoli]|uniref:C40 family peptidase n=1 Tax=Brevibacillus ginsengisoli TaxID=363854 RepID=UPI003CF4CF24
MEPIQRNSYSTRQDLLANSRQISNLYLLPSKMEQAVKSEEKRTKQDTIEISDDASRLFTATQSTDSVSASGKKPTADEQRTKILDQAKKWIGKIPYEQPGAGTVNLNKVKPKSMDCSGFTSSVYLTELNTNIGRTTKDQVKVGTEVKVGGNYKVGDLIFTDGGGHVGIYAGDGMLLHEGPQSKNSEGNVKLTPLKYMNVTAVRRVIQDDGSIKL